MLMTTTIIMGNGIGMAIDSKYFELESGLDSVIESLSDQDRKTICFKNGYVPQKEDDLEEHHKVLSACQELKKHDNSLNCLTSIGDHCKTQYFELL